ncbi:MAG TPA: Rrf2 family transcriptional regulator [Gallionellaceae bacterium]|nr:Rrf2 family transcriptional regulator [Gallionellaceae bacterium]
MQLTQYTDYSLRVLIYLGQKKDEELATITEVAEFYGISRNHLVKVVHNLAIYGFIKTLRGKHGGMRLARPASEIGIGEVVRQTEPNFDIAECFNKTNNSCVISPICSLKNMLEDARKNFLKTLDHYTIADALTPEHGLANQINIRLLK